jgi:lysophospholipase L1-like esterase
MKNKKLLYLLIPSILFFGHFSCAQKVKSAKPATDKTAQQIINEYEDWSKIRDDWPNLSYYREDNKKLDPPAANNNRVVFMGNSITERWIKASPEFFNEKPYIDRGISGQTTPQMLIRFRQDVIELQPKVVVLLCGVNDISQNTGPSSLEMIEGNIVSMAELARANHIRMILCSVLPAYDFPWRPGLKPAEKIVALNKWIKEYASNNSHMYLDYFSSMVDERNGLQSRFSEDGVHPNKMGYSVMEGLVEEAIARALKE